MCVLIYCTVFLNMSTSEVCLAYVIFWTILSSSLRLINCKSRWFRVKSIIQGYVYRAVQYWRRLLHVMSNIAVISTVDDNCGVEMVYSIYRDLSVV